MSFEILYQDADLIAVNKPSGMLVHRTRIDARETRFCVQLLRQQIGRRVYPCHRLDKPTSGILLFALNKDMLVAMNDCFTNRCVDKTYHAIVRGWPQESGLIDKPLAYQPDGGEIRGGGEPQPAITGYQIVEKYELQEPFGNYPTNRYCLLELSPQTGRQHQIRRHMKHIFHPVIGDTRYGDGAHNRFFRERFNCQRLLLHASEMTFPHPTIGRHIAIRCELPDEFHIPLPIFRTCHKSS